MAQLRRTTRRPLAALILAFCASLGAQSNSPEALQQKLNIQFKLTRTTADRTDIVTPGDVVVLHKPGLVMFDVVSPLPPTNVYKDGKIGQGFGTQMMMSGQNQRQRRFVPDERCWVTRVAVLNDGVAIDLYSDPYNDVRYYGTLKILFPNKKEFPPVDSFLQTIAEVLTVVSQDQGNQQAGGPAAPATNPAPGLQPSGFTGDYLQQARGLHLLLFPDGSCKIVDARGKPHYFGQFSVSGDSLTLDSWATSDSSTIQIRGNRLIAGRGIEWVRVGDAPAAALSPRVPGAASNAQETAFSGAYFQEATGERLTVQSDGTFNVALPAGRAVSGQYFVAGNALVITYPGAIAGERYTLLGGRLVSVTGSDFWVRTGDAPAPVPPAAPTAVSAAPGPMPVIAPPPPPSDAPPPTIALGQTKDQVTAAFGQPLREANLGAKEIFYYKDMKVTFTNGKVSDVQ